MTMTPPRSLAGSGSGRIEAELGASLQAGLQGACSLQAVCMGLHVFAWFARGLLVLSVLRVSDRQTQTQTQTDTDRHRHRQIRDIGSDSDSDSAISFPADTDLAE